MQSLLLSSLWHLTKHFRLCKNVQLIIMEIDGPEIQTTIRLRFYDRTATLLQINILKSRRPKSMPVIRLGTVLCSFKLTAYSELPSQSTLE